MILDKIPTTADEISIAQYRALMKEEDYLKQLAILTNLPEEEIKKQKKKEIDFAVYMLLKNLENVDLKVGDTKVNEYDFSRGIGEGTMAQWSDCEAMMKQYKNDFESALPFIMAIYCLKDGEEYDYTKITERAAYFDSCSYASGLRFTAFFLTKDKSFLNALQNYFPQHQLLMYKQDIVKLQESMEVLSRLND
jgi:hypothetical protein